MLLRAKWQVDQADSVLFRLSPQPTDEFQPRGRDNLRDLRLIILECRRASEY